MVYVHGVIVLLVEIHLFRLLLSAVEKMDDCGPRFANVNSSSVLRLTDEKLFLYCETKVPYQCPDPNVQIEWYQEKKEQITEFNKKNTTVLILSTSVLSSNIVYQCISSNKYGAVSRRFVLKNKNLRERKFWSEDLLLPRQDQLIWLPTEKSDRSEHIFYFGQQAHFSCPFYIRSFWMRPRVNWYFSPHDSVQAASKNSDYHILSERIADGKTLSRYSMKMDQVSCGLWPINGICFEASLFIHGVLESDRGDYKCLISPIHTDRILTATNGLDSAQEIQRVFTLLPLADPMQHFQYSEGPQGSYRQSVDSNLEKLWDPSGGHYVPEVSLALASPPFEIHFNLNSTACSGDNFSFFCRMDPSTLGNSLYLLRLDEQADLNDPQLSGDGVLDLLNSTLLKESLTEHGFTEDLVYEIASVHPKDEGYYLCIGGLNGVPRMRWQRMYLAIKNCRGTSISTVHALLVKFPNNLFVILPLSVLLTTIISVCARNCHSRNDKPEIEISRRSGMNGPTAQAKCLLCPKKGGPLNRTSNPLYPRSRLQSKTFRPQFTLSNLCVQSAGSNNRDICQPSNQFSHLQRSSTMHDDGPGSKHSSSSGRCTNHKTLTGTDQRRIFSGVWRSQSSQDFSDALKLSYSGSQSDSGYNSDRKMPYSSFIFSANSDPFKQVEEFPVCCESLDFAYKLPSDPEWELPSDSLKLGPKLGEGAFGVVYYAQLLPSQLSEKQLKRFSYHPSMSSQISSDKGTRPLPISVAVKRLHANFSDQELTDLVKEMEIMKVLGTHPNLIQIYGACTQQGPFQVVVEYAPHGNLRDFLRARRRFLAEGDPSLNELPPRPKLTKANLIDFGLQVANGMDYLSARSVVHRDLAARNVLLGKNFVVKIADFGLTRAVTDYYKKTSTGRLPIKWMAPESLFDRTYTTKSDVWSFGILLWEIFTMGGVPYPSVSPERLFTILKAGYRNDRPALASEEVYHLMLKCWNEDPQERPKFRFIVNRLATFLNSEPRCENECLHPVAISEGINPCAALTSSPQFTINGFNTSAEAIATNCSVLRKVTSQQHYVQMTEGYLIPRP